MHIITRHPLFAPLDDALRARLLDQSVTRRCDRGEFLFMQGDAADHLFIVLEGIIKVFRSAPDGRETLLHVVMPGQTFAEPAALRLGKYPANAQAEEPCVVLGIPVAPFVDMLRESPDLAIQALGLMSQRMRQLVETVERRHTQSTVQRVAAFLLELAPEGENVSVQLPYSKSLIAARLGMTAEAFSRALANLRECGVVARGQGVEIESTGRLRKLVDA